MGSVSTVGWNHYTSLRGRIGGWQPLSVPYLFDVLVSAVGVILEVAPAVHMHIPVEEFTNVSVS